MLRAARPRGGLGGGAQSLLLGFPEKPPGLETPLKVPAEQHQRAARKEGSFLHCCLAFGKQIFVCVAGGRLFFFFYFFFLFFQVPEGLLLEEMGRKCALFTFVQSSDLASPLSPLPVDFQGS